MRLEFEPDVAAIPLVENESSERLGHREQHDLDSLLKRGISAAQCGDRRLARQLLTEASDMEPSSETAWMWLASISEYPEELLTFLDRVLEINPSNDKAVEWHRATQALLAKTFVQRAIAAREDGSTSLAEQSLERALEHDGDCVAVWRLRAEWAETEEAKAEALRQVLRIEPDDRDARMTLDAVEKRRSHGALNEAKAAAAAGKRKKAIELVDEFLRAVPDNADAWVLRSNLAIDMDDKILSLEEALKIDEYNLTARAMYDFLKTALRPETVHTETSAEAEAAAAEVVELATDYTLSAPDTAGREKYLIRQDAGEATDAMTVESDEVSHGTSFDKPEPEPPSRDEPAETMIAMAVDETADGRNRDEPAGMPCPFCKAGNDPHAFNCGSCNAFLTLSDLETLFESGRADRDTVQRAVTEMEADWNLREFSVAELRALGLGHFNLGNPIAGLKYLQEASRLAPNDVILAGEVNAIAIRLDEMERQAELHSDMPTGRTILVVDDSPTVRKLISGKLEKSGHTVICAADGVEALEQLDVVLPDLVLLDITMPRMDGYEVCKQIRANPEARDLPVVMISGKDGFFDKVRGRMAGTTGYVTKPFGPETLMKALETYLVPNNEQQTAL
jgi:CheY-like chemotaxis protein